jgi:hypothetical protein
MFLEEHFRQIVKCSFNYPPFVGRMPTPVAGHPSRLPAGPQSISAHQWAFMKSHVLPSAPQRGGGCCIAFLACTVIGETVKYPTGTLVSPRLLKKRSSRNIVGRKTRGSVPAGTQLQEWTSRSSIFKSRDVGACLPTRSCAIKPNAKVFLQEHFCTRIHTMHRQIVIALR